MTDQDDDGYIPRGHFKQVAADAQKLGEALIALPAADLEALDLPTRLYDAIVTARGIKSREALRRQRQYVGKLMRDVDAAPIVAALEARKLAQRAEAQAFHRVEQWRDRLLDAASSDDGRGLSRLIDELVAEQPQTDAARLASLCRNAAVERERGGPPRTARALFRYLRELFGG
ncbi:MAG: ribosome biogenesis factor YjgA [Chromatiales bacterium]|nr:ribosome biogenesis factor YjgA [Chromatiales bacterium]MDX9767850.1 ribosome biogenesis factor YjgA [Ectothiorhodospiraceae bacterium]